MYAQDVFGYSAFGEFRGGDGTIDIIPTARLSLAAYAPSMNVGVELVVPQTTLSFATYDVNVRSSVLSVVDQGGAFGSFEFGVASFGEPAPRLLNVIIDVPLASISFTAQLPTLQVGVRLDVPLAATTTIVGYAPNVWPGVAPVLPTATVDLVAFIPTIYDTAVVMRPPIAVIQLTAWTPDIQTGLGIHTPPAQFAVVGQAPFITSGGSAFLTVTANFTFQAFVPTLEVGVKESIPSITLSLQAYAPLVSGGASVFVDNTITNTTPADTYGVGVYGHNAFAEPAVDSFAYKTVLQVSLKYFTPDVLAGVTLVPDPIVITLVGEAPEIAARRRRIRSQFVIS